MSLKASRASTLEALSASAVGKPMLAYDAFAHKLQIVGGQYKVETDDLVDGMSPGIVN